VLAIPKAEHVAFEQSVFLEREQRLEGCGHGIDTELERLLQRVGLLEPLSPSGIQRS
jgi:hypothetical protein